MFKQLTFGWGFEFDKLIAVGVSVQKVISTLKVKNTKNVSYSLIFEFMVYMEEGSISNTVSDSIRGGYET